MATTRRILGPAVRAIRDAYGLRHGELAGRAKITPGYLTLIEQGRRQPSPAVAARIALGLGVSLDSITYVCVDEVAA
jgi:transcriptional regulator with XRE-family HTH domain